MNIDFKKLSQSEGYKRLKASVLYDCYERGKKKCFRTTGCDKKPGCSHRYCDQFKYVIDLVRKCAHQTGLDPVDILNGWEKDRTCWYMNFYQACYEKRLFSLSVENAVAFNGAVDTSVSSTLDGDMVQK